MFSGLGLLGPNLNVVLGCWAWFCCKKPALKPCWKYTRGRMDFYVNQLIDDKKKSKWHPAYNNLYNCITLIQQVAECANWYMNLLNVCIYDHMYHMQMYFCQHGRWLGRFFVLSPIFIFLGKKLNISKHLRTKGSTFYSWTIKRCTAKNRLTMHGISIYP